ncbi:hypothetical protein ES703_38874 [subsurface metagenome]
MIEKISLDLIDILPEIQVRFTMYPSRVKYFKELLRDGLVDPILVTKNGPHFMLIDGYHRLEAATQLGQKTIAAKVEDIPESERMIRAYTANAKHGQPLTQEERDEFIIKQAKQGKTQEDIAKITKLSQQRISQIIGNTNISITDTKAKLGPGDRTIVLKRSINGETQEEIATDFKVSQSTISEAFSQLINEITGRYKSGKHKWEVAEEYGLTEVEMDKILAKSGDPLNLTLPENTWWPSFGLHPSQVKFPGATPLNLVKSILAYFSKPGEHIVDPMAGSGTVGLACRDMVGRTCTLFDLKPLLDPVFPISPHNLNNKGSPNLPQCQKPDLVFLDPPYSKVAQGKYSGGEDDLALLNPKEFIKFMRALLLKIKGNWAPCRVVILMANLRKAGYIYDLPSQISAMLTAKVKGVEPYRLLDHIVNEFGWTESAGLPWPTQAKHDRWLLRNHIHIIVGETNDKKNQA